MRQALCSRIFSTTDETKGSKREGGGEGCWEAGTLLPSTLRQACPPASYRELPDTTLWSPQADLGEPSEERLEAT